MTIMTMKNKPTAVIAAALILTMTGCGKSALPETPAGTSAAETTTAAKTATAAETTAAVSETTVKETETAKDDSSDKEEKETSAKAEETEAVTSEEPEKAETDDPSKEEAQKYLDEIRAAHKALNDCLSPGFSESFENNDYEKARKALDEASAVLDKMEEIKAPEKYADLHAEFLKSLVNEHKMLDYMREFTGYMEKYPDEKSRDSMPEEDMKEMQRINDEMAKLNNDENNMSHWFITIVKTVGADIKGQNTETPQ